MNVEFITQLSLSDIGVVNAKWLDTFGPVETTVLPLTLTAPAAKWEAAGYTFDYQGKLTNGVSSSPLGILYWPGSQLNDDERQSILQRIRDALWQTGPLETGVSLDITAELAITAKAREAAQKELAKQIEDRVRDLTRYIQGTNWKFPPPGPVEKSPRDDANKQYTLYKEACEHRRQLADEFFMMLPEEELDQHDPEYGVVSDSIRKQVLERRTAWKKQQDQQARQALCDWLESIAEMDLAGKVRAGYPCTDAIRQLQYQLFEDQVKETSGNNLRVTALADECPETECIDCPSTEAYQASLLLAKLPGVSEVKIMIGVWPETEELTGERSEIIRCRVLPPDAPAGMEPQWFTVESDRFSSFALPEEE